MNPEPANNLFDSRTAVLAAVVQVVLVIATALVLALLLPKSFFESWGWLSGPVAWLVCAAITALILKLDLPRAVFGAALVGIPSVVFVILGLHWLGALVAFAVVLIASSGSFPGAVVDRIEIFVTRRRALIRRCSSPASNSGVVFGVEVDLQGAGLFVRHAMKVLEDYFVWFGA